MKPEPIDYCTVGATRFRLRPVQWINLAASGSALLLGFISYLDPWYHLAGFHSGMPGSTWAALVGFVSVIMGLFAGLVSPVAWFHCRRGRVERLSLILAILYWAAFCCTRSSGG
jgi:hypothetical protein